MVKCDYVISHPRVGDKFGRSGGTAGARALAAAEAPAVAMESGGVAEVGQDAPDLRVIGTSAGIETHAAMTAVEQRDAEMLLQGPDAVGDGGRGDAEFPGGADEVLVPGRGLEEPQAVERRQGFQGIGDVWPHEDV